MSRTIRRTKENIKYQEGKLPRTVRYQCRCFYCTGVDKRNLIEKILNRELKHHIKEHGI